MRYVSHNMIKSFADRHTEALFADGRCHRAWRQIKDAAIRKLDLLHNAPKLADLRIPPGNRLHALKDDREGQYAIRINDQYRLCFRWEDDNAFDVEIVDYH